ncbi:MAG: alpha/beta hydrolase, partial [Magnetovibrio sp.]|nr:alpha/beta hydrolase [Magnetovibrio sp.]
ALSRIVCPKLLRFCPQDMAPHLPLHEAMAAAIPGARLTVIEDCAHLAPLERPDAVTSALRDWLTRDA